MMGLEAMAGPQPSLPENGMESGQWGKTNHMKNWVQNSFPLLDRPYDRPSWSPQLTTQSSLAVLSGRWGCRTGSRTGGRQCHSGPTQQTQNLLTLGHLEPCWGSTFPIGWFSYRGEKRQSVRRCHSFDAREARRSKDPTLSPHGLGLLGGGDPGSRPLRE